jgi:FkbM family methyltransferase
MKLIKNTWNGFFHKHWTLRVSFIYFLKGVVRELHLKTVFFEHRLYAVSMKKWLVRKGNTEYFEIKGAKLPIAKVEYIKNIFYVFEDTFFIPVYYNDCYDKSIVDVVDRYLFEGPYGYVDGAFDVCVKSGDVVIDVGAWIGDFSAYASTKGATVYAFEPVKESFELLQKTKVLNSANTGAIFPVHKGLSSSVGTAVISTNSGSSHMIKESSAGEKIALTTLDKFVEENKLTKVDFIKADIEGSERDMLRGATNVLRTFAPKLAICTYHLPDDPQMLEQIIREANPKYKVVQLRHKLLAAVV